MTLGCNKDTDDQPNYLLTAEQTGYAVENEGNENRLTKFGIRLELTGKYDTLPPVYYMTCSWGSQTGVIDDSKYMIGYHGCDANFQWFGDVTTNKGLELKTVIAREGLFEEFDNTTVKIGFIVIDTVELPFSKWFKMDYHDDWKGEFAQLVQDKSRIVWSTPFELKKMNNRINHWGEVRQIDSISVSYNSE